MAIKDMGRVDGLTAYEVWRAIPANAGKSEDQYIASLKGATGSNAYIHIRYSVLNPTTNDEMLTTPNDFIGIYYGTAATAPTAYTSYAWSKIKGANGAPAINAVTWSGNDMVFTKEDSTTVTLSNAKVDLRGLDGNPGPAFSYTETTLSGTTPTIATLANNTEYYATAVTKITITAFPSGKYSAMIDFTTAASGAITMDFPAGTKWIPALMTFGNSERWQMVISNGVVSAGRAL